MPASCTRTIWSGRAAVPQKRSVEVRLPIRMAAIVARAGGQAEIDRESPRRNRPGRPAGLILR
ncbi:MAG TPA: hypothetical protein DEH11_16565 [Actinobacteria bacterium]|nr:hypothetical protein [Actinomycetota bacterium]